jgi:hypothetical protein
LQENIFWLVAPFSRLDTPLGGLNGSMAWARAELEPYPRPSCVKPLLREGHNDAGPGNDGGRCPGWVVVAGLRGSIDLSVRWPKRWPKADKAPTDIGAIIVDGTLSLGEELAAIFDNQLMMTNE